VREGSSHDGEEQHVAIEEKDRDDVMDRLLQLGGDKKFLSYDDLNRELPENVVSPDDIEDVLQKLDASNIHVADSDERLIEQAAAIATDDDAQVRAFGGARIHGRTNPLSFEPCQKLRCNFRHVRLVRFGDNDSVGNFHVFSNRIKNSRFPSRPVMGDSVEFTNLKPEVSPARTHFSTAAR